MDSTDRYASAKATLRENVKWLSAGFAGMAGIVLAGTPFTGFGALPIGSPRFDAALASLIIAMVCAFVAWQVLLRMVRPDATYVRFLRTQPDGMPKGLSAEDKREYDLLKAEFERHKEELLPDGFDTFQQLEKIVDDAWNDYNRNPQDPAAKDRWSQYQGNLRMVEDWAAYTRLHQRVATGLKTVQKWGLGLLAALAIFAWSANPKAKGADQPAAINNVFYDNRAVSPPAPRELYAQLAPVMFDWGKFKLTAEGLSSITQARDYLRDRPEAAVLLLAHTDTSGSDSVNVTLATQRAQAVQDEMIREGGIPPNRIFFAALPKTDLPSLTGPQVRLADNRSVEFVVFAMPARSR